MNTSLPLASAALLLGIVAPSLASAQTNAFGYTMSSASFDYVTPPPGTGYGFTDDSFDSFTLPWAFPWYGNSYTTLYFSDNGYATFLNVNGASYGTCLPATFEDMDIAVFWTDLECGAASPGDVHTWWDQAGGNDRVIVSWEGVPYYFGTADTATFQIHLYPNGAVELHWLDTDFSDPFEDDGANAVIGIQDAAGGSYDPIVVSCFAASTLEGTAVSFSTCSDGDGDGYDDLACGGTDCDDGDAAIYPGALEVCDDAVDDNCNGLNEVSDVDGDSYVNEACVGGDDCDDGDPAINPSVDADGDGSNACDDCNDSPGLGAFLYPGNTEVCGNGIDEDCSGADDLPDSDGDGYTATACGGDDCDDTDPGVNPGIDGDGDGFTVCDGDCDDGESDAFPGNPEVCDGGVDNDCDGDVDDVDADGDGDPAIPCGGADCDDNDPNVGATTDADSDGSNACVDCDEGDATIYPGAPEVCDAIDQDCDGLDDVFDLDVNSGGSTTTNYPGAGFGAFISGFGSSPETVTVSGSTGVVTDLNLLLDVSYGPLSDLTMTITSPSGTTVTLFSGIGGNGFDLAGTTLDDEATAGIASGSAPFAGSFQPQNPLTAFDGEDPTGTWSVLGTTTDIFGFGTIDGATLVITAAAADDGDGDGAVDSCGDCDDTEATIYPGAPETCGDGIDQDCDGVDATGDLDGDTYIDSDCGGDDCDDSDAGINPSVDVDGDGSDVCDDCDDANADNFPGNPEVCADGLDQDCSGADDAGDNDGDGYIAEVCIGGDDCDDGNNAVFPGAFDQDGDGFDVCDDCYELSGDTQALMNPDGVEVCDGLDNDCDGTTDNADVDGDGYVDLTCGGEDCDDSDPAINPQTDADDDGFHACIDCDDTVDTAFPGGTEICDDGIDQNCNGSDLLGDQDGDGSDGAACGGDDCDDLDANVNPDAEDICDGVDLNCDGETVTVDADGDGFFAMGCGGADCDDANQAVHPDASEVCDGIDNNCDGALLDGGEVDADEDGVPVCADDCDDEDPELYPGAEELCDQVDNDCDGEVDEGLISDGDQDGFTRQACGGDDCDDRDPTSFPGGTEDCADGADNDCDGTVDSADEDCDFSGGCEGCSSGGSDEAPLGALAFMLLAATVRRRRVA